MSPFTRSSLLSSNHTPQQTGNTVLIGSLVRLPDNHLHISESERVLKQEDRFQELVELYNSKGLHSKGGVGRGGRGRERRSVSTCLGKDGACGSKRNAWRGIAALARAPPFSVCIFTGVVHKVT